MLVSQLGHHPGVQDLALQLSGRIRQRSRREIIGTVGTAYGAAVPGAAVTFINEGTGENYNGKTNEEGCFSLPAVEAGIYTVMVEPVGFNKSFPTSNTIGINRLPAINMTLAVGTITETMTVTGGLVGTVADPNGAVVLGVTVGGNS